MGTRSAIALASGLALVIAFFSSRGGGAQGSPDALICIVTHADATTSVRTVPTHEPYAVPNVDINGRFELKVVWVKAPIDEARLAIYTYLPGDDGPVLVHQLKFHPPFPEASPDSPYGFTGLQTVYDPTYGRELEYWCRWSAP
jgi:hypothetical protein